MLAAAETSVLWIMRLLLLLIIREVIETECMTQAEMEICDQEKKRLFSHQLNSLMCLGL